MNKPTLSTIRHSLRNLHHDQRGLETVQVLMITAIAGVCLIVVKLWWSWYAEYMSQAIQIFLEN